MYLPQTTSTTEVNNINSLRNLLSPILVKTIRIRLKDLSDTEFWLQIEECLKFLYLISIYGPSFIPLSKDLDEVWHELILQTREYAALCKRLPSGRFIHHASGSFGEYLANRDSANEIRRMVQWIPHYLKHFGAFESDRARYWTLISHLQKTYNFTLEQINQLKK